MMESIEKLRKLLDERGVEWRSDSENITFWKTDADVAAASQGYDGMLWVSARLTPEQAIAATLGAGTCKVIESEPDDQMWVYRHEFSCDCGQRNYFTASSEPPKYCPNCGRRVEQ